MELGHILWPSDPVTRESSDPETQLTLFYNELQMLTCVGVWHPVISVQQQTPDNDFCHFSISNVRFAFWAFFRKPEKLGSHAGSKWWPGDPVTWTWKMTQMTHWPGDPMTQFHVCNTLRVHCNTIKSCNAQSYNHGHWLEMWQPASVLMMCG